MGEAMKRTDVTCLDYDHSHLLEQNAALTARAEAAEQERDAVIDLLCEFHNSCDCNFGDGDTVRTRTRKLLASPATATRTRRIAALEKLYTADVTADDEIDAYVILPSSEGKIRMDAAVAARTAALAAVRATDSGKEEPT